jgi:hypothetical protein
MEGAWLQKLQGPDAESRLNAIQAFRQELRKNGGREIVQSSELHQLFQILSTRFGDDDKGIMAGECMLFLNEIIADFGQEIDSHFDVLFPPLFHSLGIRLVPQMVDWSMCCVV